MNPIEDARRLLDGPRGANTHGHVKVPDEVLAALISHAEAERGLDADSYICPNTGRRIYSWADERYVIQHEDEVKAAEAERDDWKKRAGKAEGLNKAWADTYEDMEYKSVEAMKRANRWNDLAEKGEG